MQIFELSIFVFHMPPAYFLKDDTVTISSIEAKTLTMIKVKKFETCVSFTFLYCSYNNEKFSSVLEYLLSDHGSVPSSRNL